MEENLEAMETALDSAWNEDVPAADAAGQEQTRAADAPPADGSGRENGGGAPEADDSRPGDGGDQGGDSRGDLFTLKNRGETRQVTRQELIAMAQKGWDYDNVRQERDQLRQYRQAVEQVRATIGERRTQTGVSAAPEAESLIRRVKAGARRQDMERFMQAYPAVKAEEIPREVWGRVAKGVPLVSAYAMHENQRLRAQLKAQQQDQLNRARTPGALGRSVGGELDEIDRMWTQED